MEAHVYGYPSFRHNLSLLTCREGGSGVQVRKVEQVRVKELHVNLLPAVQCPLFIIYVKAGKLRLYHVQPSVLPEVIGETNVTYFVIESSV